MGLLVRGIKQNTYGKRLIVGSRHMPGSSKRVGFRVDREEADHWLGWGYN